MMKLFKGLAICAVLSTTAHAAFAQEKVTFAAGSRAAAYMTYYATAQMGFFKDVGLDAEMIQTGSGAKALAAAAGGSVDVVMSSPAEIVKARQKGVDLIAFAAVATELGTNIVFSKEWAARHNIKKDSSLDARVAALKGSRLAISSPGSLTDAVARYFARRGGFDPDRDLTLMGIVNQSNAMMTAMAHGRIDGFVLAPPDTNVAVHDMDAVIAFNLAGGEIPELGGYFYISLSGPDKFVRSEKARKVARAFQMTLDAIHDPKRTNLVRDKVHAAEFPAVAPAIFAEVWKNVIVGTPKTLQIDDGMFDKVILLEKVIASDFNAATINTSYTNVAAKAATP